MFIDDDFCHHSYQIIDEEGKLKIPAEVLWEMGVNPNEEVQILAGPRCIIIEPISEAMYYRPSSAVQKFEQKRKNFLLKFD